MLVPLSPMRHRHPNPHHNQIHARPPRSPSSIALSDEVLGFDEAGDAVRPRLEPSSSFRCLGSGPALGTHRVLQRLFWSSRASGRHH